MRSHILPALALPMLAVATTALAADLPSRRVPPVYLPPPIPVFTWTGFFVGGNAGATFDSGRNNSYFFPQGSISGSTGTSGVLSSTGARGNTVGFTGGGQIGYNYQLGGAGFGGFGFGGGGLIVGAVADAQYRDRRNDGNASVFNAITPGNAFVAVPGLPRTNIVTTAQRRDDFFGTVRGRLGVGFDRVMVYGTGGLAYNTRTTGYTYGGGVEFSITNNVSVGAEYLRINLNRGLGTASATYVPSAGLGAGTLLVNTRGGNDSFNVARAFVNYRFVTPVAAPVVARY